MPFGNISAFSSPPECVCALLQTLPLYGEFSEAFLTEYHIPTIIAII